LQNIFGVFQDDRAAGFSPPPSRREKLRRAIGPEIGS
jgi:hypothetical protein